MKQNNTLDNKYIFVSAYIRHDIEILASSILLCIIFQHVENDGSQILTKEECKIRLADMESPPCHHAISIYFITCSKSLFDKA